MRVYRNIFLIILMMITVTAAAVNYGDQYTRLFDVKYTDLTKDAKKQVDCLAENIYHEAGSESEQGKVAVAMVTLNRVQDPRYPKDICSVVKQKVNYTCQFSWFCSAPKLNRNSETFNDSMQVALHVYANYENLKDITKGALYYHADYVNPNWKLQKTTVIGRHIFYKEGGKNNDAKTKSTTQGRPI